MFNPGVALFSGNICTAFSSGICISEDLGYCAFSWAWTSDILYNYAIFRSFQADFLAILSRSPLLTQELYNWDCRCSPFLSDAVSANSGCGTGPVSRHPASFTLFMTPVSSLLLVYRAVIMPPTSATRTTLPQARIPPNPASHICGVVQLPGRYSS